MGWVVLKVCLGLVILDLNLVLVSEWVCKYACVSGYVCVCFLIFLVVRDKYEVGKELNFIMVRVRIRKKKNKGVEGMCKVVIIFDKI